MRGTNGGAEAPPFRVVPRRAVMLTDGVPLVQVKSAAGVRSQPVRLGAQDGMNVEILEGLQEGDVVVY